LFLFIIYFIFNAFYFVKRIR